MEWYLKALKNYVNFQGRAQRKEYWFFVLFYILFAIVAGIADGLLGLTDPETGMGPIYMLYALAMLLPGLAVLVRRLHDTGRSGWWVLIAFVPLVGAIVLLVFCVFDSQPGDNEHGPNPKAVTA